LKKFTKELKAWFHENRKIMVESAYMIFKFWKMLDFFDLFNRFSVFKRKNGRKTAKNRKCPFNLNLKMMFFHLFHQKKSHPDLRLPVSGMKENESSKKRTK